MVEFSAPDGVALVPKWMLASLRMREGAQARLTSVPIKEVPSGTFAKFYSESPDFIALAAAAGTKVRGWV